MPSTSELACFVKCRILLLHFKCGRALLCSKNRFSVGYFSFSKRIRNTFSLGMNAKMELDRIFASQTGILACRVSQKAFPCYKVRIILQFENWNGKPYFVLTQGRRWKQRNSGSFIISSPNAAH
ncbi:hypothetical protein PMPD1_2243 [Paramixta manurensis]|uniref:Bacterial CdiA-CT RNAse A domain-containing protein n=1 Tax=Paramixta manurensis TaxID=2740817 RepID=A0A6M8U8Z8_9GAMM|nr:hypothetical protein PMPD1_2243 [Erwiniaceae bacterium PD-1]